MISVSVEKSVRGACFLLILSFVAGAAYSQDLNVPGQSVIAEAVHPGDVIRTAIWREPDLSGEFTVDALGVAVLPLLGPVQVTGKTAEGLVAEINSRYEKYLRNPSIQITILRRVAVQGEVRSPGLYPVDATVSISDVLAMAGGFTQNANRKNIQLLRNDSILDVSLNPNMIVLRSPVLSGDEILVGQKSWFKRNSGIIVGATITGVAIIIANSVVR